MGNDDELLRGSRRQLSDLFQNVARMLAICATAWAIFCLPFIVYGAWGGRLLFGTGYLITLCYYWRGFGHPSLRSTRFLWLASVVVQGAWLTFFAAADSIGHLGGGPSGLIMLGWWILATAAGALGLWLDPGSSAALKPANYESR